PMPTQRDRRCLSRERHDIAAGADRSANRTVSPAKPVTNTTIIGILLYLGKRKIAERTTIAAKNSSTGPATMKSSEITTLLKAWSRGDAAALGRLTPLIYDELRQLARRYMRYERSGHTLQATALTNEAYLRLVEGKNVDWQDRAHFLAVSAQIMR